MGMEDLISEIGIDEDGRLYVKPSTQAFPMIYREAMEVHWSSEQRYLYGAMPRQWSYLDWFYQILRAASEQGCKLVLGPDVSWINVPVELQQQIEDGQRGENT